jgi:hypothetical protein
VSVTASVKPHRSVKNGQEYSKCCADDIKVTGTQTGRFFGETSRKAVAGSRQQRPHIRLVEVKMLMWRGALLLLWSLTPSRGANILFFHNMGTKYADPVFFNV